MMRRKYFKEGKEKWGAGDERSFAPYTPDYCYCYYY